MSFSGAQNIQRTGSNAQNVPVPQVIRSDALIFDELPIPPNAQVEVQILQMKRRC